MKIIHGQHRAMGSTVFAVEDPSAVVCKKLKKKGHGTAPIYLVCPSEPNRCQSGWQLSLTPHCLRPFKDGRSALEIFSDDVLECHKAAQASYTRLATMFKENSLLGFLLTGGNEEFWTFGLLRQPGRGRELISLILRRLGSGILDCGITCSNRNPKALSIVSKRLSIFAILQFLAILAFRRRLHRRSKL